MSVDATPARMTVTAWRDQTVEAAGHRPGSPYIEHVYLGLLGPLLEAAAAALRPGGVFACSTEAGADGEGCELQPTLRYRHSRPYLLERARAAGFRLLGCEQGPLRDEGGSTLSGLYLCLVCL